MIKFSSLEIMNNKGERRLVQDWSFYEGIATLPSTRADFYSVLNFSFLGIVSGTFAIDDHHLKEKRKISILKFSFSFRDLPSFCAFFVFPKSLKKSFTLIAKIFSGYWRFKTKEKTSFAKFSFAIDLCQKNNASYILFTPSDSSSGDVDPQIKSLLKDKNGVYIFSPCNASHKKVKTFSLSKSLRTAPMKLIFLRLAIFFFAFASISIIYVGNTFIQKETNSILIIILLSLLMFCFCFMGCFLSFFAKQRRHFLERAFEKANFAAIASGAIIAYILFFVLKKLSVIQPVQGAINVFSISLAFLLLFCPFIARPFSKKLSFKSPS